MVPPATTAPHGIAIEELERSTSLRSVERLSFGDTTLGNFVIQGENKVVLKNIMPKLEDRVQCVYIDPPYNNQERYNHYTDGMDHESWLNKLEDRLHLLRQCLTRTGSLWMSIDDREVHYLKIAADRIFGRGNFISTIVWQQRTTRENRKVFSNNHEYVLLYAKDYDLFRDHRNQLPPTDELLNRYRNPDDDPRGPWQSISANVQAGHATESQFYELVAPNGKVHRPPKGRCWAYNKEKMQKKIENGEVWFGRDGDGVPRIKKYLSDSELGLTPETLWLASEAGSNREAKQHLLELFPDQPVFDTPKPEQLLHRILQIATDPGDYVLDAYLGSGTTAAVALKMGRRFIGIEEGEHAVTHCADRLATVVDGDDDGGVSEELNWDGGAGFEFLRHDGDG